jgi:hypothetical protein
MEAVMTPSLHRCHTPASTGGHGGSHVGILQKLMNQTGRECISCAGRINLFA